MKNHMLRRSGLALPGERPPLTKSQLLRLAILDVWKESRERQQGVPSEAHYEHRMDELIAAERRLLEPPPQANP